MNKRKLVYQIIKYCKEKYHQKPGEIRIKTSQIHKFYLDNNIKYSNWNCELTTLRYHFKTLGFDTTIKNRGVYTKKSEV